MSVWPTLLRDIKKTAVHQHQQNIGTGNYNRYAMLSPRGRILSVGKRQLEPTSEDSEQAAKLPKLNSNLVMTQLKDQDGILNQLDLLVEEISKDSAVPDPDPRVGTLCKIVKLLATSQRNLTSAVIDAAKVSSSGTRYAPEPGASSHSASYGPKKKR
jgi:hypothetical protein